MHNKTMRVLARSCLVSLFIPSALDKIFNWDEAIKQAKQGPLPEAAPLLMTAAIATEIMTPLAIVSGVKDREAAALLAGFCTATAVFYHRFWTHDDLLQKGKSAGREELWEFLKNFGLVGGLLYVVMEPKRPKRIHVGRRSR